MFDRFRDSIVAPGNLIQYRKDSLFYVFLYILFFAALFALPAFADVVTYDGLSFSQQREIREAYTPPEEDCDIVNARLFCAAPTRDALFTHGGVQFSVDSHDTLDTEAYGGYTAHVVIHDEAVHFFVPTAFGDPVHAVDIEELEDSMHDVTLNPETEEEEEALFSALFGSIDSMLVDYRLLWGAPQIIGSFFSGVVIFLIFVLLNSYLIGFRIPGVPFRQMFTMITYASTLLFAVLIFNQFYDIMQFSIILFLVLLFIAFRQTSKLGYELLKKTRK